jgi:hypothetical protein
MKVEERHLIDSIKDFPARVVELMLRKQVEQGNKEDISVFQRKCDASLIEGGFNWSRTVEDTPFWSKIINLHQFGLIPEEVPAKTVEEPTPSPAININLKVGDRIVAKLEKKSTERVVVAILEGADYPILTVSPLGFTELPSGTNRQFTITSHKLDEIKLNLLELS